MPIIHLNNITIMEERRISEEMTSSNLFTSSIYATPPVATDHVTDKFNIFEWILHNKYYLIGGTCGFLLLLFPIVVICCRKRCAVRKVRKFQSQTSRTSQKSVEDTLMQQDKRLLQFETADDEEMVFTACHDEDEKSPHHKTAVHVEDIPKKSKVSRRPRPASAEFESRSIHPIPPSHRYSHTIVPTDGLKLSESSNQSQLTILENLTYDDVITTVPVYLRNTSRETAETDTSKRPTNSEHQYETITCTSDGKMKIDVTRKKKYLRPPSPIQLKRESKSEDTTIFPSRISRSMNQYEMMSLERKIKQTSKTIPVSKSDIRKANGKNEKIVPPPTLIKRKTENSLDKRLSHNRLSKHSSDETEKKVAVKTKEKAHSTKMEDKKMKDPMQHVINTLAEEKTFAERIKNIRSSRIKTGKVRKNKNKSSKGTNTKSTRKVLDTQPQIRRRVKRKVKKKRKNRDELRRKLHMRLMGCNSIDPGSTHCGEAVGTGCSYMETNNNRSSGFAVGRKSNNPNFYIGGDSTESEYEILGSSLRRYTSPESTFNRERRWEDSCLREASLLEEIWKHLQAIAERSKLLKDSSSSRRRSNSLTSTDTSVARKNTRSTSKPQRPETENIENVNSDDSHSDKGYYTYSNFQGAVGGISISKNSTSSTKPELSVHGVRSKVLLRCGGPNIQDDKNSGYTLPSSDNKKSSEVQMVYERLQDCCTFQSSANVTPLACPVTSCQQQVEKLTENVVLSNISSPIFTSDTCCSTLSPVVKKRFRTEVPLADRNLWKSEICKGVLTPPRTFFRNTTNRWRKRINSESNYVVISPNILLKKRTFLITPKLFECIKEKSQPNEQEGSVPNELAIPLHVFMEIHM